MPIKSDPYVLLSRPPTDRRRREVEGMASPMASFRADTTLTTADSTIHKADKV